MTDTKLMRVDQKRLGKVVYPRIFFTNEVLKIFDFEPETMVSALNEDGVLKLVAQGVGLDVYKNIVGDVRSKKGQLFQVLNNIYRYGKKCWGLSIEGSWLKRLGFAIDELLLVRFSTRVIEIKKLDSQILGLESDMRLTTLRIYNNSGVPSIMIFGSLLDVCGFKIGESAVLTYTDGGRTLSFIPHKGKRTTFSREGIPPQINVRSKKRKYLEKPVPMIQFSGLWLTEAGYEVGEHFLIAYKENLLIIKKINVDAFF